MKLVFDLHHQEQTVQGAILGNAQVFWKDTAKQQGGQQQARQTNNSADFQRTQPNHQAQNYQQAQAGYAQQQAPQQGGMNNDYDIDFDDDIAFASIGLMYDNALIHCI